MKWEIAQKVLDKDDWLKYVLFYGQWTDRELPLSLQKNIVECNVTHIMFRGGIGALRIDSRPVQRTMKFSSYEPAVVQHTTHHYDDYNDHLGYEVGYFLVIQAFEPEQVIVAHMSKTPDRIQGIPNTRSIRWEAVKQFKMLDLRPHKWIAVVRNVSIISLGEYLMNGYDVFKFPSDFHPMKANWHKIR